MLFYAAFTWHSHTTGEQVRARHDAQFRAGALHPETWRGWYGLAGGAAGFLLIEADDAQALTPLLQPYSDLMRWDVRAVYPINIETVMSDLRARNG